ncbi:unnamed protein product [Closterium sp. NIES-64]|nr:unnamed protein product [Closterium sp. NIES-64]CAI5986105.1 unnamed protein product [Closterium sp. NIES-65]
MAHVQSTSSARVITFAVLYSASICALILPLLRPAEAVPLSDVLSKLRHKDQFLTGHLSSSGMVEFAAGYEKVNDISGVSLLLPENDAWNSALMGYQGMNPSATTATDPLLEALDTMVKSKGAVASLNAMSANAKNAMSRLAKFMAIREYISSQDMASGKYKDGRFSLNTLVNQPLYLYGNVTGDGSDTALDHVFIGTDLGPIEAVRAIATNSSDPMSMQFRKWGNAGVPKAVARVNQAVGEGVTGKFLGITTLSSDTEAIEVSSVVFPANMGSLTSYDAVTPYGKGAGTFALYGNSMALVLSMIAASLI